MIAKEYLKSLTDPEKDAEDLTAETPVKENGVGIQFSLTCQILRVNQCPLWKDECFQSPLKRNNLHPEENCGSTTSRKRRTINQAAAPEASPRKSSRVASTGSVEGSPRKSTRLQGTPQKSDPSILSPKCMKTNTPEASQRKSSRLQNTPKKASVTQMAVTPTAKGAKKNLKVQLATPQACSSTKTENRVTWKATKHQVPKVCIKGPICICYKHHHLRGWIPWIDRMSGSFVFCVLLLTARQKVIFTSLSVSMQEPAVLQPLHVLQCHSKQDSPDDFSTQLWACAFEPTHDNSSEYLAMQHL